MLGTDLLAMSVDQLNLVSAPEVLAVHQDSLGIPGDMVWKEGPAEVSFLSALVRTYGHLNERCQSIALCTSEML